MLRNYLPIAALFAIVPFAANAEENEALTKRDAIVQFLEENMIGGTLTYTYEGVMADGTIYTAFHRNKTYRDLKKTKRGFTYKVLYVIEQKNWDLDQNGDKLEPASPRMKNRVLAESIAVSELQSIGEVVGISTIDGNSLVDNTGNAESVRMSLTELEDGTPALQIVTKTVLYSDHFATGDSYSPGTIESKQRLFVKNERLHATYSYTTYTVDPQSLAIVDGTKPRTEQSEEHEAE